MTKPNEPKHPDLFCLTCGYALRNLPEDRCPECGRPFDPANPRTVSVGYPLKSWQRWLLKPIGWPMIALPVLGTIGIAYLSRWPGVTPEPIELLRGEFHWLDHEQMPPTMSDIIFYASLISWALFIIWSFLSQLSLVLLLPRAGRRAVAPERGGRRRRVTILLALAVALLFFIFGWPERIGRRWGARLGSPVPQRMKHNFTWKMSPVELSLEQAEDLLNRVAIEFPSHDRLEGLRSLVEFLGRNALPSLAQATRTERDEQMLAWEIRVIGICRDPSTASLLIEYLKDTRPAVRAAAADAIGLLRYPSYLNGASKIDTQPPIDVTQIFSRPSIYTYDSHSEFYDVFGEPAVVIAPSVRGLLQHMMTDGTTEEEREAAARSLVNWPPEHYRLRVAEWGVWTANEGQMALVRSVLDETPPFVHGAGNSLASFEDYRSFSGMAVFKPIVHLTTDVPLAVDFQVHLRNGRPWYAYPKPDDFQLDDEPEDGDGTPTSDGHLGGSTRPTVDDFANPAIPPLTDCRLGYPWLQPHHHTIAFNQAGNGIAQLGLRWQSLILSPARLAWMKTADVPASPKHDWWKRLRDLPSCWIDSRGESERFLYYDGPQQSAVPLLSTLESNGHKVRFARIVKDSDLPQAPNTDEPIRPPLPQTMPSGPETYDGFYVEVHGGQVRAKEIPISDEGLAALADYPLIVGESDVIEKFRQMLVRYGLTGPEADGLIFSWTRQFFHSEGRRMILRMSHDDYSRQCPMQMRPLPTEVVRLGLVLTEFDQQSPTTQPAKTSRGNPNG